MITSTSQGKHVEGHIFHLNTLNRTSVIFRGRMFLSLFTKVQVGQQVENDINKGDSSAHLIDNGTNKLEYMEGLSLMKIAPIKKALSFKLWKKNLFS